MPDVLTQKLHVVLFGLCATLLQSLQGDTRRACGTDQSASPDMHDVCVLVLLKWQRKTNNIKSWWTC